MICLIPVRPGDHNPELKYALRSIQTNLPAVTQIWTVGHHPTWCTPDRHIPGNTGPTAQANVYRNILAGCQAAAHTSEILISNDDIYITAPTPRVTPQYRGTLADHLNLPRVRRARGQWWPTSLATTQLALQAHGIADPTSWELHTPFPCHPARMAETLTLMQHVTPDNPPQWRSLYGNLNHVRGDQTTDVKAYTAGALQAPYHSTDDTSYRHFADQLAATFPTPSRWETP